MKLHYKGKYDLNPESLPRGEHKDNAVPFKEVSDTKKLGLVGNLVGLILIILLAIPAYIRCKDSVNQIQMIFGALAPTFALLPHELLHAICFREDVYLYTNFGQGMLFVIGTETMSKRRFIFMSLLPNIVLGFIPFALGMIFPQLTFCAVFGTFSISAGVIDYYNVFNALTQMPKGSRTYLYKMNSYWYLPE